MWVLLLVALAFLVAPSPVKSSDDDFELLYSAPDKWLEVWSDHAIDQARCKMIADRVRKAYTFVGREEGWRNPAVLFKAPLKIRVVEGKKSAIWQLLIPSATRRKICCSLSESSKF